MKIIIIKICHGWTNTAVILVIDYSKWEETIQYLLSMQAASSMSTSFMNQSQQKEKLRTSSFSTLKHWCHSSKLLISWIELSVLIISSVSCDAIYLRSLINQSTFSFLRFITASPSAILPFWASVRTCRWPKCIIITDKLSFTYYRWRWRKNNWNLPNSTWKHVQILIILEEKRSS